MTDSTKFVQWLGDRVQSALSEAKSSGDPLVAWRVLDEVQRAFDGRVTMLFGAVVSSHLPALQRELGPWISKELTRVSSELEAGVLRPLGVSPAPTPKAGGFFSRLGQLFGGPTPSTATTGAPVDEETAHAIDEQAALAFAERAGLALAHLLQHPSPRVRGVMARALNSRDAAPRLEAQLEREPDAEVAQRLVKQLNRLEVAPAAGVVKAVGDRFPPLRPLLLVGQLSATPESMREAVSTAATRVDALLALADDGVRAHPAMRNQLILDALADDDLAVSRAALKGVRTWRMTAAGPRVLALTREGRADALETLAVLSEDEPSLGFDLLLENAGKTPPVLTGLELLAGARKLSLEQLDRLEALLPTLPEGPAATAIRRRLARAKPQTGGTASLATLEAAIDEHPDDVNAWLVWSDAAQGAGDVRGELVALAHSGKPVSEALLRALPTLAPTLAEVMEKPGALLDDVQLHMGLPRELRLRMHDDDGKGTQAEVLTAVLGAPLGRFITSVRLGLTSEVGDENDWAPALEALNRYGRGVRSLVLGDFEYPDECEMSWVQWGDVSGAWTLPVLERLHLRGGDGEPGTMSSPTLQELVIETGGLRRAVFETLLSARLPSLTSLTVWTGDPDYGGDTAADDVVALLDWAPPSLRRLGVENCAFTHELVPLLARHPRLKQLTRLSFAMGVLRPEDADTVVANAPAFAHLEHLDLSGNLLDDDAAQRIVAALPRAIVANQREDYGEEGDRYVAVGE